MLLLTATTDYLELTTVNALSTDWTVSYVDISTGAFLPGSGSGNIPAASTVTIVPAPAVSVQRQVKMITVVNRDLVTTQTLYIDKNSGGVVYHVTGPMQLAPGATLVYVDGKGFYILNALGAVATTGVQGPTGAAGANGATGPAGPGASTYTYTQSSPATVWTINHGLGRFPSVSVVDSTDREVEGDILYVDSNHITLTFTAGFSGSAYLN
jgi:hypothetical protein